jgi:hypothetical protein
MKNPLESFWRFGWIRDEISFQRFHSISPKFLSKRRQVGSAKGMITIAPDFDEPLEEFREYME